MSEISKCIFSIFVLTFSSASLLSGARNARNLILAERVTRRMRELFPNFQDDLAVANILLANTLASSGKLEQASSLRLRLNQNGLKKQAGLSWTEIRGEVVVSEEFL